MDSAAAPTSPFLRAVPLQVARSEWRRCCDAAGCPARMPAESVAVGGAIGRVTAEPIWALRSSPPFDCAAMGGSAGRAAETVGASESRPLLLDPARFTVVDTGD